MLYWNKCPRCTLEVFQVFSQRRRKEKKIARKDSYTARFTLQHHRRTLHPTLPLPSLPPTPPPPPPPSPSTRRANMGVNTGVMKNMRELCDSRDILCLLYSLNKEWSTS